MGNPSRTLDIYAANITTYGKKVWEHTEKSAADVLLFTETHRRGQQAQRMREDYGRAGWDCLIAEAAASSTSATGTHGGAMACARRGQPVAWLDPHHADALGGLASATVDFGLDRRRRA